jgi:hypothetical protein
MCGCVWNAGFGCPISPALTADVASSLWWLSDKTWWVLITLWSIFTPESRVSDPGWCHDGLGGGSTHGGFGPWRLATLLAIVRRVGLAVSIMDPWELYY